MIMDPRFAGFSDSINGFEFDDGTIFPNSNQYPNFLNNVNFNEDPSLDSINFVESLFAPTDPDPSNSSPPSSGASMEGESPSDDSDFLETVQYISQMLMEEDMAEKPCMFHDPLSLQAAEKSFYEVLGEKYPNSPNQPPRCADQVVESPDVCFSGSFNDYSSISSSGSSTGNLVDRGWNGDFGEYKPSLLQTPLPSNFVFQSTAKSSSQSSFNIQNGFGNDHSRQVGSSVSELLVPNFCSESESILLFKRGVEEASKFLPKGNQLVIDLENNILAPKLNEKDSKVVVKAEKDESEYSSNGLRGKKNHEREDVDVEEGRSTKQSAVYVDESELSEMFDKVLLCTGGRGDPGCTPEEALENGASKTLQQKGQTNGFSVGKTRVKNQGNKKEIVDLRTRLILCAQAVSSDDRSTANKILKQIRQHSSPFGDGSQRLAHWFANSLEARLAGTGTQIYTALSSKRTSAADMLKAYQVYMSACPFNKIAIIFANYNILKMAEKATSLHIIDFGILYGFQWPELIHRLSLRDGGPPKLRITGIELPQRGFRPAERVQETGRRLAKYCERFKVPFEYNAIAKKWETIQIDDLNINRDEVLAVNCLFRFKNLLDETVVVSSPRNAVLNLIRKASPNIFVQGIVNGSYNAPFYVTRFREVLFHFSALFDMWDANIPREDEMRLMFEKEFYGREAMNVVACEGSERVERPETYKQWQVRNMRAGFKQLPLNRELMKKLRCRVKASYTNDFVFDEDGHWMLQGWKGRIVNASSAWVPV